MATNQMIYLAPVLNINPNKYGFRVSLITHDHPY